MWNLQRWLVNDKPETYCQGERVTKSLCLDVKDSNSLLVNELLVHHKWRVTTGEEEEEDINEETIELAKEPKEESEKSVPNYVKMTEAVMSRCLHALPSPVKERQLIALATLKTGVQILAPHENQLLPMVHKIWSPLLQRFSPSQDVVVLRHSFDLLCTMAHAAKSFLRKRTLNKVLPSITTFLKRQATETRKQRCVW